MAGEAAQEVLLSLLLSSGTRARPTKPAGYVARLVWRSVSRVARKRNRALVLARELADAQRGSWHGAVEALCALLAPLELWSLWLINVHGLTAREVSVEIGFAPTDVTRIKRARLSAVRRVARATGARELRDLLPVGAEPERDLRRYGIPLPTRGGG